MLDAHISQYSAEHSTVCSHQMLTRSVSVVSCRTLSNDMDLFVELHFPPYYWSVSANAIHVTVGQCATRAAPTDQSPLERCKLSWPLEYRIRKEFLPDLLHDVRPLPDAAWSWDSASEVVSTCDCSWLTAIQALVQCKNDQNRAIEAIVKEQAAAAEREAAAKPRGSKKTSSSSKGSKAKPAKKKPKTAASYISSLFTSSVADTAPDSPPVLIPAPVPAPTTTPNKAESSVMSACGVSLYVARRALALCNGAVEGAMDLLSSEQTIEDLEAEEANTTAAHSSLLPAASPSLVSNTSSSISFSSDAGPQSEEDQLLSLMAQHNYLVRLLRFIKQKIHRIHSTCMLCEKPLAFPGLNLSVCQSSLCRMSYESMGVGFDIGTAIAAAPVLTDLYISLLASAVSASHLPFAKPLTVTGTGKDGVETSFVLALPAYVAAPAPAAAAAAAEEEKKDSGPQLDYNKLTETIHRLPAVSAMVEHIRDGTFVEKMNALDPLILPLLRWLFQSCPTYVRELTPAERFASIPTPFQFVMLMSSPEREHSFQQLKAASGKPSMWAWHGGPSKNWHSIIRAGLKNMSNSKYMAHGAAYGQGIYMAKDSSTSLGYSGLHGGYSAASFGWNRRSDSCTVRSHLLGAARRFTAAPSLTVANMTNRLLCAFSAAVPSRPVLCSSPCAR